MTEPVETIWQRLAEPFNQSCIEWLPKVAKARAADMNARGYGKGTALALAYIDARSVMARLDEVLGPDGWQDSYRVEGTRTICRLEILIDGAWVAKEDGSGDSQVEAEKGGISGAFKRAGVKWGIGRYLYDVDDVWAECEVRGSKKNGKDVFYHQRWTADGIVALEAALGRSGSPRETGKPFSYQMALEKIAEAADVPALRKLYTEHWEAVSLEYRAEFLRKLDERKLTIQETTKQLEDHSQSQDGGE